MPKELEIIITSTVFAAFITSLSNLVITLFNNKRLNAIERRKDRNEIDKYRYIQLHEMILKWDKYNSIEFDSTKIGETEEECIEYAKKCKEYILNIFIDDKRRYNVVRPLLSEQFIMELDEIKEEGDELLYKIAYCEDKEEHLDLEKKYANTSDKFTSKLKSAINQQLADLLKIEYDK